MEAVLPPSQMVFLVSYHIVKKMTRVLHRRYNGIVIIDDDNDDGDNGKRRKI